MTHEVRTITRDIADRLQDLKSADDWRAAELAEQIALQAERLDRLTWAQERPAGRRGERPQVAASVAPATS
jgi:hypothetical protein